MNETLEILEKVDAFYSSSFETLVTLTFSILAFAGILIPILIAYIQNRQLKIENSLLSKKLENEVSKHNEKNEELIKSSILEEKKQIEEELNSIKTELHKRISKSEAGLFHIQANHELSTYPENAITSFCSAALRYIYADDEQNLQRVLNCITKDCLPKINNSHFEEDQNILHGLEKIIDELTQNNPNGRYSDRLFDMNREISLSRKRIEVS
ncbi:hypothetical protein [Pseudomonas sp. 1928-m]|uniref:hypothetical protein n=1 Tax=Pseudomonas sp. 1928-m TaxID=3033804 RepID=UPI0023DE8672|nr:hypothetical protein [Pseudomonas sp. 1928-m]MDF3196666.1 hypothetical protein [Pseudomonas sp. 1928-m]